MGRLVLSRAVGQRIFINGDEIIVTVIRIGEKDVHLLIDAPDEIPVDREERFLVKRRERSWWEGEEDRDGGGPGRPGR